MKLIEMAKHHSHENHLEKLIDYCNNSNYVVKAKDPYDGTVKIIISAGYFDQEHLDKYHAPEEKMTPFVAATFAGHDESEIYDPDDFANSAQVFELKRVL